MAFAALSLGQSRVPACDLLQLFGDLLWRSLGLGFGVRRELGLRIVLRVQNSPDHLLSEIQVSDFEKEVRGQSQLEQKVWVFLP